jgi:hypothetical protein
MTARIRGPLAAACLIALTFAASSSGTAIADTASTIGWVRVAHLSPNTMPVDWYVYPSGSANASQVVKDIAYGSASPYESLAPGNYIVAVRAAGTAVTSNAEASVNLVVSAGQAYTVAGLGVASVPSLRVLNDQLDSTQGKADVRVIEASQRNPAVSVTTGGQAVASNLQFPDASDYQTVDPGMRALKVTAQGGTASAQLNVNFAAGSTYTVAVVDGSGINPQILALTDGTGLGVAPKGGVNTGLGGTAAAGQSSSANVFPAYLIVSLIAAASAVAFGYSRRRKQTSA